MVLKALKLGETTQRAKGKRQRENEAASVGGGVGKPCAPVREARPARGPELWTRRPGCAPRSDPCIQPRRTGSWRPRQEERQQRGPRRAGGRAREKRAGARPEPRARRVLGLGLCHDEGAAGSVLTAVTDSGAPAGATGRRRAHSAFQQLRKGPHALALGRDWRRVRRAPSGEASSAAPPCVRPLRSAGPDGPQMPSPGTVPPAVPLTRRGAPPPPRPPAAHTAGAAARRTPGPGPRTPPGKQVLADLCAEVAPE